ASILIRDIRDLGTYKDLNKDHADVNDDQVLITLNLAAEVDGLDLVRQQLETQNTQLGTEVERHVETTTRQGELVDQQAEQLEVATKERATEREQFKETVRGHKTQTRLLEEHSRALEAESARVKVEVDELLKVMSLKSGTLTASVSAVVRAQAAFTDAADASHKKGTANNTTMAGHLGTFRETLDQATGDHAKLAKVRDEFMLLMTVEEERLRPLKEFMEHVAQNPTATANLQAAAAAHHQVEESTRRHAALETQVAALTTQLEGLKPAIAEAEKRLHTASAQVLDVTGTLAAVRDDAVHAVQTAALQQQQQLGSPGHHGAGGNLFLLSPRKDLDTVV
nr:hypothetical protein [Chlamydiota bacterium]